MVTSLFEVLYGHFPTGSYNMRSAAIQIDAYYAQPLQYTFDLPGTTPESRCFDISKCYPTVAALLRISSISPCTRSTILLSPINGTDKLTCSEYYQDKVKITRYKTLSGESIVITPSFYSREPMQYLLDNRLLTKSAIKYHITASMTLKTDTFKEFLQVVFSNFTEGVAKELANRFIGNLDGKYDKRHKGFLSTSYDNVCCMWTESVAKGRRVEVSHFDNGEGEGLFMAKEIDVQRKLSDNCSVNRQVDNRATRIDQQSLR